MRRIIFLVKERSTEVTNFIDISTRLIIDSKNRGIKEKQFSIELWNEENSIENIEVRTREGGRRRRVKKVRRERGRGRETKEINNIWKKNNETRSRAHLSVINR